MQKGWSKITRVSESAYVHELSTEKTYHERIYYVAIRLLSLDMDVPQPKYTETSQYNS